MQRGIRSVHEGGARKMPARPDGGKQAAGNRSSCGGMVYQKVGLASMRSHEQGGALSSRQRPPGSGCQGLGHYRQPGRGIKSVKTCFRQHGRQLAMPAKLKNQTISQRELLGKPTTCYRSGPAVRSARLLAATPVGASRCRSARSPECSWSCTPGRRATSSSAVLACARFGWSSR